MKIGDTIKIVIYPDPLSPENHRIVPAEEPGFKGLPLFLGTMTIDSLPPVCNHEVVEHYGHSQFKCANCWADMEAVTFRVKVKEEKKSVSKV